MGSQGTRLHRDCHAIGDTAKISRRVPSTCGKNAILCLLIIWDCKVMGDTADISARVPSTCAQYTNLSLLIIHIIPTCRIYVAIDNPSFIPSVSCLITGSYLWNNVRTADNIFHTKNLQSNGYGDFLTCTNFETGSKLPEFSGIVVSARAFMFSMKAPSSFWSLFLNRCCSCHGRRPFSAP